MGTAQRLHVLQIVDWSKYSPAQWLEQYSAWVQSGLKLPDLGYPQPLAHTIDLAKKKKPKNKPVLATLEITDDEARAVMRILCSMMDSRHIWVSTWAGILILRYESNWEWPSIAGVYNIPVHKARELEKEGLAYFMGCIDGRPD